MPEKALQLSNVSYRVGDFNLSLDFSVRHGELVSVIGPSGSGKSTLLSIISGLVPCRSGSITLNGRDITFLSSDQRGTGLVFQDYALFPHMSVGQNIAYPMKARKLKKREILAETDRLLNLVSLPGFQRRKISELSGGEKQRVAIARSLAAQPDLLLLDEPLSALDANLRANLRNEIRRIIKTSGTTAIYVTHDQEEAMAISDRVIILNKGRIEQMGTPEEVYKTPRTIFAAKFTGLCNIVNYSMVADLLTIPPEDKTPYQPKSLGTGHMAVFRPEDVAICDNPWLRIPQLSAHLFFENVGVTGCCFMGRDYLVTCEYNGIRILARSKERPVSKAVSLTVPMSAVNEYYHEDRISKQ